MFAIQETNFPFICMVVDDSSTDNNQDVIKQYAQDNCDMSKAEFSEDEVSNYIRVAHKANANCVFLFCLLKVNLYCKPEKQEIYKPYREVCEYEAICEGDDWWISENKLQKQFDILEEHPEVDMCACGTRCFRDGKVIRSITPSKNDCILSVTDTISGGGCFLGTNSLMHRVSFFYDRYQFWRYFSLDYLCQIHGALRGGIILPIFYTTYEEIQDVLTKAHRVNEKKGLIYATQNQTVEKLVEKLKDAVTYVALNTEGKVIATASIQFRKINHWYHNGDIGLIKLVGVLPEYSGRKLALLILRLLHFEAQTKGIMVLVSDSAEENLAMRNLYLNNGYKIVDCCKYSTNNFLSVVYAYWFHGCPHIWKKKCREDSTIIKRKFCNNLIEYQVSVSSYCSKVLGLINPDMIEYELANN